jgi:hypothetical protein
MNRLNVCSLPGTSSASRLFRFLSRSRLFQEESGGAMVELAMLVYFVGTPLILATGQMGMLVYDSIEVSNAAHAGTSYAMQSTTWASDTAGITAAARGEAADLGTSLSVTPTTYYVCSNAMGGTQYTGSTAQSDANAACSGTSNRAVEMVQVNTSVAVSSLIRCPGLPKTYTLTGTAAMEVGN